MIIQSIASIILALALSATPSTSWSAASEVSSSAPALKIIYLCNVDDVGTVTSRQYIFQKPICIYPEKVEWEAFKIRSELPFPRSEYETVTEFNIPKLELEIRDAIFPIKSNETAQAVISGIMAKYDFILLQANGNAEDKYHFVRNAKILTLPTINTDERYDARTSWMDSKEIITVNVRDFEGSATIELRYTKPR